MLSPVSIFKKTSLRFMLKVILIWMLMIVTVDSTCAFSSETDANFAPSEKKAEKNFDAGKMIMQHIIDAHEWHILDIGDVHLSIPLPIILYTPGKGLDIFMSGRFEHGHATHNGFQYTDGHIVSVEGILFYDFSITKNTLAMMISLLILCLVFFSVAKSYKRNRDKAPSGLQSMMEPLILFVRDEIARPSIGPKYEKYVPFLLSVFFFILLNNFMGLIPIMPGGANVTGSVAVCLVLAAFTFVITTFSANKNYWIHIVNTPGVPWWLKFPIPLMPIVEIFGVIIKPVVLMIRLFANITAGHIIVLSFFSLIFIFAEMNEILGLGVSLFSLAFTLFMNMLELLVAFLQAYVFTLLSAIYFGLAVEEHHHDHDHQTTEVPSLHS
jgi:F-type H+-transporting ATPase subunit a